MQVDLQKLLMEYCNAVPEHIQKKNVPDCTISITNLRDGLYLLGNILYEDLDNQIYIASIRAGFANMDSAVVVMQLQESRLILLGYAKEGLLKQNLCEDAFQKIENLVQGKTISDTSRFPKILAIIFGVIGLTTLLLIRGCVLNNADPDVIDEVLQSLPTESSVMESAETTEKIETTEATESIETTEDPAFVAEVELTIAATKEYNNAIKQFNRYAEEYNHAIPHVCIDNIVDLPRELEQLSLESETYEDNTNVVISDYNKEKIAADTKQVRELTTQVKMLLKVIQQIQTPDGAFVCKKLSNVEGITGCQQVTKELNPDGLLGKEGGYSACVYFTHAGVAQDGIPGNSIVAKGTDAGGAVEVYPTLTDAEARVEYLAGFDNTILYSGSYAIVGTMVVRTSYKLTDEQQFALTNAITMALTTVDDPTK